MHLLLVILVLTTCISAYPMDKTRPSKRLKSLDNTPQPSFATSPLSDQSSLSYFPSLTHASIPTIPTVQDYLISSPSSHILEFPSDIVVKEHVKGNGEDMYLISTRLSIQELKGVYGENIWNLSSSTGKVFDWLNS